MVTEEDNGLDGVSYEIIIMLTGDDGEVLNGISCTTMAKNEFEGQGLGFSISNILVKNFETDGII